MKKVLKLSLLFTLLIASVSLYAGEIENTTKNKKPKSSTIKDNLVIREKNQKVSVLLLNSDLSPVKIIIRDGIGRIIFSETITNKTIHKSFNFKSAYKGFYNISVKDGLKSYTKEIEIL